MISFLDQHGKAWKENKQRENTKKTNGFCVILVAERREKPPCSANASSMSAPSARLRPTADRSVRLPVGITWPLGGGRAGGLHLPRASLVGETAVAWEGDRKESEGVGW